MPTDGKLRVGELLPDHTVPRGYVVEIVAIHTGALPTPIDPSVPSWSSSAETCAMFGAPVRHDAHAPRKVTR